LTDTEIYCALTEIFNDVFMRENMQLRPELTASDVPGWDSFKQIEIIMASEDRFGVNLPMQKIDQIMNVGDLVQALAAEINSGS
jgi:acyl carrier protein